MYLAAERAIGGRGERAVWGRGQPAVWGRARRRWAGHAARGARLGLGQASDILRERAAAAATASVGPAIVPWDRGLTANPDAGVQINRGCPVGYFAQFVGADEPGAAPYRGETWIRCRQMAGVTAATIQTESGTTWRETLAIYREAVKDTLPQVPRLFGKWLGWAALGVVGVAAVLAGAYGYGSGVARR